MCCVYVTCTCRPSAIRVRMSDVKLAPGLVSARPLSNFIFVTCKKITAELGAAKTEEE